MSIWRWADLLCPMAQCELVHLGSTLPSGPFTQDVIATATGLSGLAAGLAGAVITIAVAILVDRFSYGPAFLIEGLLVGGSARRGHFGRTTRTTLALVAGAETSPGWQVGAPAT